MNAFVLINVLCVFHAGFVYGKPSVAVSSSQSESSMSVSESSYSSSSSSSSAVSCSNIDTALYTKAFGLANICEAESALYMQYLSQLSDSQVSYFNDLINLYSSQSFALADSVTDFVAFQNAMSSIYSTFQAQSLYAASADWATQTALYEQAKANFATALGCCAPNSALYNLVNFASTDLTYMPLVAGTCYHLATLQNQFYTPSATTTKSVSSSSSTTSVGSSSVSTSSSCSNIDTSLYTNAFGLASINEAESALYMQYLSQLPSTQVSYFNDLINLYSSQSFALADSVTDFVAFQNAMSSIYSTFQAQSLYASSADWATQTALYEQAKANFATALGCCAPNSALYNLINFASTDLTYMPLVAGSCYHLATLQNQFYTPSPTTTKSVSSSSSTTSVGSSSVSTSSSCSNIDTTLYTKAFGLASINEAESALYMQYLSQLPSNQITYFNDLINLYSSQSFALADSVTDFVAFQNAMSSIYSTFQAQSLYAASADWATQTALYEQAKANFATALGCCAPNSALYNLINFASSDLTYMPLVAGSCYHLANLQNQYYSAAGGSSASYSESSSYQASSSSSSMSAASGSLVSVC